MRGANIRMRWVAYKRILRLTWNETDPAERAVWVPFAVIIVPAHAAASELSYLLRLRKRKQL